MTVQEILILILIALPAMIFLFFWIKYDLENKSNSVLIDPKTGKVISRFRNWLEKNGSKK